MTHENFSKIRLNTWKQEGSTWSGINNPRNIRYNFLTILSGSLCFFPRGAPTLKKVAAKIVGLNHNASRSMSGWWSTTIGGH
jgi:hypothetical protein